jgi:uncharacterized protein YggE
MVSRRSFIVMVAFAAACSALLAPRALAQIVPGANLPTTGGNVIAAAGAATVQRLPTSIRMTLSVSAKGKTIEDALAKLKERREKLTAELQKLNADKKDIRVDNPAVSAAETDRQRQIEALVAERVGKGKRPKGLEFTPNFAVVCTMTVEWPLSAKTAEEFLVQSHALTEKIKAAELAKSDEKLTPEEEEVAAELAEQSRNGRDNANAGEPQFVFVARLSDADRQKCFADAFAQAKKHAEELAKAAGVELGPLVGLSGQGTGSQQQNRDESYGGYSQRERPAAWPLSENSEPYSVESVAADPDSLSFNFEINAMFKIGK